MTAAPQPSARQEIGVLYGVRAIFVLLVCNYHIWQQSWLPQQVTLLGGTWSFDYITRSSYVFVDGMLLLSAFLLFLPYARQRETGAPVPTARQFYVNRAARILPSYLLSVGVMLAAALAGDGYGNAGAAWTDVLTHLTFTFTYSKATYLYTPLNVALWTIAVEMQFYLIFPLLARGMRKHPGWTLGGMALVGWLYRAFVYWRCPDTALLVNRLPAFLDVYALGFAGAMAWRWLERQTGLARRCVTVASVAGFPLLLLALSELVMAQSRQGVISQEALRLSQLALRLPLAIVLLLLMLCCTQWPRLLRKLLDNRLTRFLSAISLNLYIWHQVLCVRLRASLFGAALHTDPKQQMALTLLCYALGVLIAMACTYGL